VDMVSRWEYVEYAVADSRKRAVLQHGEWASVPLFFIRRISSSLQLNICITLNQRIS
jgi:hypothetical protein